MQISYDEENNSVTIVCSSDEYKRLQMAIVNYERKLTYARNYYHKTKETQKQKKKKEKKKEKSPRCSVMELIKPIQEFSIE